MKTFFKVILMVVVVLTLIGVAQQIMGFNLINIVQNILGGTKLESVRTTVGQEIVTPVFEVVSLEIFHPHNMVVIEANKFEWWRLNIGTVYIFAEYDSYLRLGVRNPETIRVERDGDTVYVDEATIVIELLDAKLNNYKYVRTFTSNPLVLNNDAEKYLFQALNEMEAELIATNIERGQANFEYAKKNFMKNYENLCGAMGLNVVWRVSPTEES